jgi:hypothetical protein
MKNQIQTRTSQSQIISQAQVNPSKLPKSKKISLLGFIPLTILFLFFRYDLAYRDSKLKQQLTQQQIQPTTTQIAAGELIKWKTYRNEEYGFELRYPESFFSQDYPSGIRRGEKFGVSFADEKWEGQGVHNPSLIVSVIATELSPQEWLEENYDPAVVHPPECSADPPFGYRDVQDTTVNGMAAIKFQFLTTSDSSMTTVIQGPGTLYRIAAISSGLGNFPKELYDQILSTFKLLPDTHDWKT